MPRFSLAWGPFASYIERSFIGDGYISGGVRDRWWLSNAPRFRFLGAEVRVSWCQSWTFLVPRLGFGRIAGCRARIPDERLRMVASLFYGS